MRTSDRDSRRYRLIAEATTMSPLSRRTFLEAALATGILSPHCPRLGASASETKKRLVAGTRTARGKWPRSASVQPHWTGERPHSAPAVSGSVWISQITRQQTLVHWHGQLPPWTQDGFPWPETPALGDGPVQSYDYRPIPGTYWMHSHHGLQDQVLMTAP